MQSLTEDEHDKIDHLTWLRVKSLCDGCIHNTPYFSDEHAHNYCMSQNTWLKVRRYVETDWIRDNGTSSSGHAQRSPT